MPRNHIAQQVLFAPVPSCASEARRLQALSALQLEAQERTDDGEGEADSPALLAVLCREVQRHEEATHPLGACADVDVCLAEARELGLGVVGPDSDRLWRVEEELEKADVAVARQAAATDTDTALPGRQRRNSTTTSAPARHALPAAPKRRAASESATTTYRKGRVPSCVLDEEEEPREQDVEDLDEYSEEVASRCARKQLVQLVLPTEPQDRRAIEQLAELIERGFTRKNATEEAAKGIRDGRDTSTAVAYAMRVLKAVFKRTEWTEKMIIDAMVGLLNATAEHLAHAALPSLSQDKDTRLEKPLAPRHALWHAVNKEPELYPNLYRDPPDVIPDKPDLVALLESRPFRDDAQVSFEAICTFAEVQRSASLDLGKHVSRQVLHNVTQMMSRSPMMGRSFAFTMCGPIFRLWHFDAMGFSVSRALDVTRAGNSLELAQMLAFLTGPSDQLRERWELPQDRHLLVRDPNTASVAQLEIVVPPRLLARSSTLWGSRTVFWGGGKVRRREGSLDEGGSFLAAPDQQAPTVDFVLKASWVPDYLEHHEHVMLDYIASKGVKDVPKSLGLLCLPSDFRTVENPELDSLRQTDGEEAAATSLKLRVMALDSPTGIPVPDSLDDFPLRLRMRLFRDLLIKLRQLARFKVHYRDLNLGNILLKPNWQELVQDSNASLLLLIDFGSSRLGDQPRGHSDDSVLPSPLGLDDSLFVNCYFMSCNALQRPSYVADLEELYTKDPKKWDRWESSRANDLEAELAQMNHRYIDDGESAMYCFLVQLGMACSPAISQHWEREVLAPIIGQKSVCWPTATKFGGRLQKGASIKDGPLTDEARLTLEDVADCIRIAQARIRKLGYAQPEALSVEEGEAFANAIGALDDYLRRSGTDLHSAMPGLALASNPEAERRMGASVAAESGPPARPDLAGRLG